MANPSIAKLTGLKGSLSQITTSATPTTYTTVTSSPSLLGGVIGTITTAEGIINIKDLKTSTVYPVLTNATLAGMGSGAVSFPIPIYFESGFAVNSTIASQKVIINYTTI